MLQNKKGSCILKNLTYMGLFLSSIALSDTVLDHPILKQSKLSFREPDMQVLYSRPSVDENYQIQKSRLQIEQLLKLVGGGWFKHVMGEVDGKQVNYNTWLSEMKHTPVWLCDGKCNHFLTKSISGTRSTLITLSKQNVDWVSGFIEVAAQAMASLSSTKFDSETKIPPIIKFLREQYSRALSFQSECPGPYRAGSFEYLRKSNHLNTVNASLTRCGFKYILPLLDHKLSARCQLLFTEPTWDLFLQLSLGGRSPRVYRCDASCNWLTCGTKKVEEKSIPIRVIRFAEFAVVSVEEGACNGVDPEFLQPFVKDLVRTLGNKKVNDPLFESLVEACTTDLVGRLAKKTVPQGAKGGSTIEPELPL